MEKQKDAARKKKSENGNERRLQTVGEVEQELNLQDQAECLSAADSDWEKRCSFALSSSILPGL